MNSEQNRRSKFVLLLIMVAGAVLAGFLYWIQIVKGSAYSAKAENQYVKPTSVLFDRGTIFFSTKDGAKTAAAGVAAGYVVYLNPSQITDVAGTYDALSQYLKLDRDSFSVLAMKPHDSYEELRNRVSEAVARPIIGLGLKGVGVIKENWRFYTGDGMAAHELGLIGESADGSVEGRYGLERFYESTLARVGISSSVNIFAQIFTGLRDTVLGGRKEGDIVTTVEPTVQGYLEKILADTDKAWHPDEIGGIIMDPATGEIVAMSSLPSFNPNDVSKVRNPSVFSNPLVEHVYEMGSIMKPLTIAAGLDAGAITPAWTYDDKGALILSGKKISNYDGKARGITSVQQILSQSLNVGAATVALAIGKDNFEKYFHSFGLGEKTGIDQPNEAVGLTTNLKTGRDIEIATAAYGQGVAVSPVEMTRALSILANGGYLVTPHLVREVDYADGSIDATPIVKSAALLRKQTVDDVTGMLVTVVDTALRNGTLKMERYSVAAKTGTAQIHNPANKAYYTDRYLHSFFGYFPAYDPKFIIFLYQKYPKGAQYASETLADPFAKLEKFLINYYNIPPDR